MGILGLTHDERGSAVQRLPVSIKVAIGEGPDPSNPNGHPKKLDHFVFKRKAMKGKDVAWEADTDVTARYGENCKEIGIVFMDDDIENVFRTNLTWWKATERQCWGELVQIEGEWKMQATRRTEKHSEGEPWPGPYKYSDGPKKGQRVEPCGDGCPDLEAGRCKPSADLYFQLDKFPMLGAVCRLHTTSYQSIRQISSGLQQVIQTFGGLAGVRMMLKVRPEKVKYADADGKKKTSTAHILSIELDADDWKKLLANATEMKQLFQSQRKMLGAHSVQIVEDEEELAPELSAEFHPVADDDDSPRQLPAAQLEKAEIPTSLEEAGQRSEIHKLCLAIGFNQAKESMLIGQHQGRLGELVETLKKLAGDTAGPVETKSEAKAEPAAPSTAAAKPAGGKAGKFAF